MGRPKKEVAALQPGDRVTYTCFTGKQYSGSISNIEGKTAWVLFDDRPITEAMNLSTLKKERQ